ncbi:MAG: 50S ribosomal protein L15 [Patescibacteria group bacterium]
MKLHALPSLVKKKMKRLGRGSGSGRGKTAGRGTKGQKARGTVPRDFEGGQLALTKRFPLLRGKTRNKSMRPYTVTLNLSRLSIMDSGTNVTLETLKKYGIVDTSTVSVKLVRGGILTKALTVSIPRSKGAKEDILKAGGSVGK